MLSGLRCEVGRVCVPSSSSLSALTEEIVAYEKENDETHHVKKLDALRTPESYVTHSNFDTPGATVYYIPKVSADVLLVKRNVYDPVDDCVIAYMKEFGDVVSFDATFKTNKYKIVFVPFTVIDNHWKCITVGAGLLKNETTKSYIWLLKAFIKAFGKAPSIVVTDQDGAMRNAIKADFAGSKHRLCMWHITQKLHAKVYIIKESPYVYEMPKKKKKPQSVDKGKDKAEENNTVYLFFKKDGLYKVLRNNANVVMISQQYILRRWTNNLIHATLRNKRNRYSEKNVVVENFADEETLIVDHCVHFLSKDEPRLGAFVEKLKSLKKDVEADCQNPPSKSKTDNLEQLVGVLKPPAVEVNNPTIGSTKGRKKLRIKGGKEKAIEKSLKGRNSCSLCGGTDHNKRTCPRRPLDMLDGFILVNLLQLQMNSQWQPILVMLCLQLVEILLVEKFAFVEMRSVEEASNAMALDGIIFDGALVKVRRPSDYNLSLVATLGPSQPNPNLNLGAVGLTPGGLEGHDHIFDLSVTYIACAALNGIKMGTEPSQLDELTKVKLNRSGECTVTSTTTNCAAGEKLMLQPAPIGSPPTKVLSLMQAVTEEELINDEDYEDIIEEMKIECGKFGKQPVKREEITVIGDCLKILMLLHTSSKVAESQTSLMSLLLEALSWFYQLQRMIPIR
nr:protein FAR1-related sequence 5 [Tanacetum cinerariifolium]